MSKSTKMLAEWVLDDQVYEYGLAPFLPWTPQILAISSVIRASYKGEQVIVVIPITCLFQSHLVCVNEVIFFLENPKITKEKGLVAKGNKLRWGGWYFLLPTCLTSGREEELEDG